MSTGVKVNGFHFFKKEHRKKKVKISRAISERRSRSCKTVCMETQSHLRLPPRYQVSVAQKPKTSLARLTIKVSRSHTIWDKNQVGLFWTSDQFVAETAT